MAVNDFSNQNIQDTYQRVVQTDGTNVADGTGSLLPISFEGNNVIVPGALKAQSYIVSESIINVSSGSTVFGNSLDDTHTFKGAITSSGGISSSGQINANKIRAGNYAGSSVFDIAAGAGGIDTDGAMSCTGFSNSSTTTLGGRVILTGASAYIETPSYVSASRIITTNLTASGNISSSENIIANRFFAEGALAKGHISLNSSNSHLGVNTGWTVGTNLTASGDISASRIIASKATINEGFIIVTGSSTSHGFQLSRDGLDTYKIRHLDGGLTIQNSSDNRKEMTFDGTGNVGIGTTSPTSKLQVEGSISASGFIRGGSGTFGKFTMNNDQLVFTENDTTGFTFQSETINVKVNDQDFIDLEADESLIKMFKGTRFSSNINVLSNITASGNISASGTGNNIFGGDILLNGDRSIKDITGLNDLDIVPGAKLRLGNTSTDVVEIGRQSGTGAAGRTEIYANTSTPAAKFSLSTITFNHPITASNDISASGELSVTNNTFIGGRLSVNTTSTTGRVNVVGTQAHQLSGGSNTFKITGVSNTNALFISSSGKVGVGTTSPEESLHVVGNVRIASSDPNLRIEDTNGRSVEIDVTDDTFRIDDVGNNAAIFTTDLSTNPTQTTFQTKPTFLRDAVFEGEISASGHLSTAGITSSGDVHVDQYIYHDGDLTNYHRFISNKQKFVVGNDLSIDLDNGVSTFGVASKTTTVQGNELNLTGPVTASGDISASGRIYGRQLEQHDMGAGSFAVSQTPTFFPFGGQSHVESTSNVNQNIQKLAIVPGKPIKVIIRSVTPGNGLGNTGYTCSYHSTGLVPGAPGTLKLIGEQRANSTGTNHETVTFDFTGGVTSGSYDDVLPGERVYMALQSDTSVSSITVLGATALWEWDYNSI